MLRCKIFWDTNNTNFQRKNSILELVKNNDWDMVEILYIICWKTLINPNLDVKLYNTEFRNLILFDKNIVTGLIKWNDYLYKEMRKIKLEEKMKKGQIDVLTSREVFNLTSRTSMRCKLLKSIGQSPMDHIQKESFLQFKNH